VFYMCVKFCYVFVVAISHDEAIQELLVLRAQVAELRSAQPRPRTGIYQSQPAKVGHHSASSIPTSDLAQAFEMSENLVSSVAVQLHLLLVN